ncbi:helix-turn-helix transcriptional regulator [Kitasatospora sp. NPDC052896]|uniref:helix-turn-helix transcriptional regulator n=1 Tax=Kitasatospora sp. NPDC052896 TaxID=3364061 RepID=UPI0037C8ADA5
MHHARTRPPSRPSRDTTDKLKLRQVLTELGMSRSAFYRMRARGKAPRCIKLPNGQLRVRRTDLDTWLTDHEDRPC